VAYHAKSDINNCDYPHVCHHCGSSTGLDSDGYMTQKARYQTVRPNCRACSADNKPWATWKPLAVAPQLSDIKFKDVTLSSHRPIDYRRSGRHNTRRIEVKESKDPQIQNNRKRSAPPMDRRRRKKSRRSVSESESTDEKGSSCSDESNKSESSSSSPSDSDSEGSGSESSSHTDDMAKNMRELRAQMYKRKNT
jgi:hypothetical protein